MQVPLLLTRQVFVKLIPASTLVLSGIVTSITKDALFVQSGIFVGRGVSAVAVNSGNGVAKVSVAIGVSVIWAGKSVWVGDWVSVDVDMAATNAAAVELRIELADAKGNRMTYLLAPAFTIGDVPLFPRRRP